MEVEIGGGKDCGGVKETIVTLSVGALKFSEALASMEA